MRSRSLAALEAVPGAEPERFALSGSLMKGPLLTEQRSAAIKC